jgi:hypothetical protein
VTVSAPSDFQRGVQWATSKVWNVDRRLAKEILQDCPPDTDGTEASVVRQIATWLRESGAVAATQKETDGRVALYRELAVKVERGEWRPR